MTEETRPVVSRLANGACELCNRMWWVFLIGGIASVIFGILAFMNPAAALLVLSMFFAAYVLVDGAANIWGSITNRDKDGWWMLLVLGIVGLLVGGFALLNPPVSMLAFIYVVAFFMMFIGISSLYVGWKVRMEISGEWMLYLTGILSVLFALLIIFSPGIGGLSVTYLIASWAILSGAIRIVFAFKARKMRESLEDVATPA